MKNFLCAGLCGLTLLSAHAATLTNIAGKTIEAEIGEISLLDVVLKVGGKDYKVALKTLSKESNQLLSKLKDERKAAAQKASAEKMAAEVAAKGTFEEVTSHFEPALQDTKITFEDFYSKGHPEARDQFETQQEYEARLPKIFDSTQILSFELTHEAAYSYDIDAQKLTVSAGGVCNPDYSTYRLNRNIPFKVFQRLQRGASYQGVTASGREFVVDVTMLHSYFLHLTNGESLPESLKIPFKEPSQTKGHEQLALTITLPRDKAKEIAPRVALVCRVKFTDYSKSASECTELIKPTIANPRETGFFSWGIDAELISLHLIDKLSKQEFARWSQGVTNK